MISQASANLVFRRSKYIFGSKIREKEFMLSFPNLEVKEKLEDKTHRCIHFMCSANEALSLASF